MLCLLSLIFIPLYSFQHYDLTRLAGQRLLVVASFPRNFVKNYWYAHIRVYLFSFLPIGFARTDFSGRSSNCLATTISGHMCVHGTIVQEYPHSLCRQRTEQFRSSMSGHCLGLPASGIPVRHHDHVTVPGSRNRPTKVNNQS